MKRKNTLLVLFLFSFLLISYNNGTYLEIVYNTNFKEVVKIALEKKELKKDKKEKDNKKNIPYISKIKFVKENILFKFICLSYDKIYGKNNLKYLE